MNFIQLQYQPVQLISLSSSAAVQFDQKIRVINQARLNINQSIKQQLAVQQEQFDFDQFQTSEAQYLDFATILSRDLIDELMTDETVKWQKYLTGQRKSMPLQVRTPERFTAKSQAMLDFFAAELSPLIDNTRVNTVTRFIDQNQQLQLTEQLSDYRSAKVMAVIFDRDHAKLVAVRTNEHESPTVISAQTFDRNFIEALASQWSVDTILLASTHPLVAPKLQYDFAWLIYPINGLLSTSFLEGQSPIWEPISSPQVNDLDPLVNAGYQLLRRYDIHSIKNLESYRKLLKA